MKPRLALPLAQKWQALQGQSPRIPIVDRGSVYIRSRRGTAVLNEADGSLRQVRAENACFYSLREMVWVDKDGFVAEERESGRRRRLPGLSGREYVVRDDSVIVQGIGVARLDLRRERVAWHVEKERATGWANAPAVTAAEVVFGHDGGDVVCVELANGEERWRHSVSDLPWFSKVDTKCYPTGRLAIHEDRVIVQARGRFVVGLDLKTGKRMWTVGPISYCDGILFGDLFYAIAGRYRVINPKNGKIVAELGEPVDLGQPGGINGPAAVSETHVYCATHFGPIIAWERETGKLAGLIRGKGACGSATIAKYLLIKNGRLYYADASLSIFCFEEVNPTDLVLKKQRAEAKATGLGDGVINAGVLDFSRERAPTRVPVKAKRASPKRSVKVTPRKPTATGSSGKKAPTGTRRGKA